MNPLYWQDAYQKEFEAEVEAVSGEGEKAGKFITLDKTCFYPTGGGQPFDTGFIKAAKGEYKVLFVGKFNGKISHEVDKAGLKVGDKVNGVLNWERRYKLMKMHTTAHLLAAIINKETGALITGNQLEEDKSRIDFSLENFDKEKMQEYVEKANQHIQEKLPVSSFFISLEEAKKDESLFKLAKGFSHALEELRIVEIKGVDKQADGGTHVKSLQEIGKIVLLKVDNKGKDNRRMYYTLE